MKAPRFPSLLEEFNQQLSLRADILPKSLQDLLDSHVLRQVVDFALDSLPAPPWPKSVSLQQVDRFEPPPLQPAPQAQPRPRSTQQKASLPPSSRSRPRLPENHISKGH